MSWVFSWEFGWREGDGDEMRANDVFGGIGVIMCFGYRRRKRRRMGILRWPGRRLSRVLDLGNGLA